MKLPLFSWREYTTSKHYQCWPPHSISLHSLHADFSQETKPNFMSILFIYWCDLAIASWWHLKNQEEDNGQDTVVSQSSLILHCIKCSICYLASTYWLRVAYSFSDPLLNQQPAIKLFVYHFYYMINIHGNFQSMWQQALSLMWFEGDNKG